MNTLAEFLSSRTRAEILRLLFGASGGAPHTREIQRRTRSSLGAVQQELQKLRRLGLVDVHRDGNRVTYAANRSHPLYPEIHRLVLKTGGLADLLRIALTHPKIESAFVFGSLARGEETAESDVDLLVIGDIGLRGVTGLLSGIAEQVGREINPHVLRRAEFLKRKRENEAFLMRVLAAPKLFVVGEAHEFEAMVEYCAVQKHVQQVTPDRTDRGESPRRGGGPPLSVGPAGRAEDLRRALQERGPSPRTRRRERT